MPWCPLCAEEYEPGIFRCADCGASLVPEAPLPEFPDDPKKPEELIRSRDSQFLKRAVDYLATQSIPAEVVPVSDEAGSGFALTVDAGLWDPAVALIVPFLGSSPDPDDPDQPIPPTADTSFWARPSTLLAPFPGSSPESGLTAPLRESLDRPLEEIVDRGEDSLLDLAKTILVADRPLLLKAETALARIGEPARVLLTGMLQDALREEDAWRVRRIAQALARFSSPDTRDFLFKRLDSGEHRLSVISALGYLDDLGVVPRLVSLLDDNDSSVRDEAAESLYNITGESFDFEADDPPDVRNEVIEQWVRWMRAHELWRGDDLP